MFYRAWRAGVATGYIPKLHRYNPDWAVLCSLDDVSWHFATQSDLENFSQPLWKD